MSGVGCVRVFWANGREREKQVLQKRGRKTFFPYLCATTRRRWCTMPSKQHRFASFFSKNSEWNDIVLYKMRCFIKKKSIKKCQFPNQSSIEILILRINSIASLSNSNVSPEVGHIFSLWSLVLNLCILTLNSSTNFQFLQYDLWFGQFQSLCLRVFFNLVLGFGFLQLSS